MAREPLAGVFLHTLAGMSPTTAPTRVAPEVLFEKEFTVVLQRELVLPGGYTDQSVYLALVTAFNPVDAVKNAIQDALWITKAAFEKGQLARMMTEDECRVLIVLKGHAESAT